MPLGTLTLICTSAPLVGFLLALTVTGILKMLVTGLALTSGYAVIVLMTMYAPALCRRSSATWTLAVTMVTFAAWLVARPFNPGLPDAIFFTLPASLLTFLAVAALAPRH